MLMTKRDLYNVPRRSEAGEVGFLISMHCEKADSFGGFHNANRGFKKI